MKHWTTVVYLPLMLAVIASACAPQMPQASSGGVERTTGKRRIVGVMFADPAGLHQELTNPVPTGGAVPGLVELYQMLDAGVTYLDDENVRRPWLAEAVPTVENGLWKVFPDGRMETTWRLKPGVMWHDGTPFGADDLRFTLDVWRDREIGVVDPAAFKLIESIDAADPQTAVVKWRSPYTDADTLFSGASTMMPLPRHILEQPFGENKANFLSLPYWREAFIGAGAFKMQEWALGSHATLAANDNYVLGRPRIDEIEVRFFTERGALMAGLLSGELQKPIGKVLGLEQVLQIRDKSQDVNVQLGRDLGGVLPVYPQFINPDPPIVANLPFRRALLMAIDREEMTETLNLGLGPVAHTWLPSDLPEYKAVEQSIVRYGYDPRAAAQMIEALGYTRGADGIFQDAAGQKLSVQIQTHEQNTFHIPGTLAVAAYWQRMGVAVTTDVLSEARTSDRKYRAEFPAFATISKGTPPNGAFNGSSIPLPENNFAGGNVARYATSELDTMIERFVTTIPLPERLGFLADIVRHQTDQVTMLPLFYQGTATVLGSTRIKGVTSAKIWNAHLWELG